MTDTSSTRTLVVVNPHASNGRTGRRWARIKSVLSDRLSSFDERQTQRPGEAEDIAREALLDGYDRIIAVGGDGTNSEVANGFFRGAEPVNPSAVLAIVPSGTGGDYRRTLGLPSDPIDAVPAVLGADVHPVDLGRITFVGHDGEQRSRIFINIASFGMGGLVDRLVNESSKMLGGKASFFMGSFRALLRYRNQRVRLVLDHGRADMELPIFNIAVCNGRYFGGGMHVAPQARTDDGRLDVVVLGDLGFGAKMSLSSRIYKGKHIGMPGVLTDTALHVHAESKEEVLLDVDGEAPGRLPATFEVLPGALRLQF